MNAAKLIDSLERFPARLIIMVDQISPADAAWKPPAVPPANHWSILEIVNHLADEESLDFRTRLKLTLEDAETDWPRIDPEGWAIDRSYNTKALDESTARFIAERKQSVAWLRSLLHRGEPDWGLAHTHPKIGPIRAGDLLLAWAAHDLLHLKQITKRLFQLAERDGQPFMSRYAGEWT